MRSFILFCATVLLPTVTAYSAQRFVPERGGEAYSLRVATDAALPSDEENTGAYLGVDISDVTPERVPALKLKDERGVEVTIVDQDAPAGKAGLKEHDVILSMNGTNVDSGAQLRRMIRETPPGRTVTFVVSREGQPVTVKVQLADRRKSMAYTAHSKDFHFEMPPMPPLLEFDMPASVVVVHSPMRSGLMVENITPQLGEFFGVRSGKGVMVRSVEKGSHAEKSGFRAGDIIVRVNDQLVSDTSDFSHALRSGNRNSVTIGIIRDKKEQNIILTLPERKDSGEFLDESFEEPDDNAEIHLDTSEMRDEMAQMKPQMQFALQESWQGIEQIRPEIEKARRAAVDAIEREKPEIERAVREAKSANERFQREFCAQQRNLRHQAQKMQKQLQKQQQEILRDNKRQMERLQHELRGDWMQI